MKVRYLCPIIAGAGALTALCSCGTTTISVKQFRDAVKDTMTKYVLYDHCTFTGRAKNDQHEPPFDYDNFVINMSFDSTTGYKFDSWAGQKGDDDTAKTAIKTYLEDVCIPGMVNVWGIGGFTDKQCENLSKSVEIKTNPYAIKGRFLDGDYYDVQYDGNGMATRFRMEYDWLDDNYYDFTVTHTGNSHEWSAPSLHS